MTKRVGLLGVALGSMTAAGCLLVEPTELHPEEIRAGIYSVEVSTHTDTCFPLRGQGDLGLRDVEVSYSKISPWAAQFLDGSLRSFYRYDLLADDGYQSTRGRGLLFGGECRGNATFLEHNELVAANESGFLVRQRTDWTVTQPCLDPTVSVMPMESCRVDQDYVYELRQVCEEPCQVHIDEGGAFCRCF